jgi:hypothetical protein
MLPTPPPIPKTSPSISVVIRYANKNQIKHPETIIINTNQIESNDQQHIGRNFFN